MPAPSHLHGRSLLAVFAHPDDESLACGGLLAWCAHLGAEVSLLCMTRGEHGRGAGDVGRTRQRELQAAARALGIRTVTLLDHEDGMLPWLPAGTLRSAVEREIRARRPEVVITFDADGLYWHPDHIAVHESTTAAVMALGAAAPALYYATMPPGSMRAVADHAGRAVGRRARVDPVSTGGDTAGPGHPQDDRNQRPTTTILGIADPDAFGSAAPEPTLVVNAADFAARKLAALACHASQFRDSALAYVTERDAPRLLGVEHYRRSGAGSTKPTFLESLGTRFESNHRPGADGTGGGLLPATHAR
jgi:LmbE family N-acetylglucosaminyl deacetylase